MVALLLVATFMSVTPARAQSADTWKSIAIIEGSTAAGAFVGYKVGGSRGTYVGAAVGASAGYAIDMRRRQNENYYSDNGGHYGNDDPYSGNGGYYGDSRNTYPHPSGYQSNINDQRQVPRRR